jgi:hypothetical protein
MLKLEDVPFMVAEAYTTSSLCVRYAFDVCPLCCLLCICRVSAVVRGHHRWIGIQLPSFFKFKSNFHNLTTQALTFVNLPSQHGRRPGNWSAAFDFELVTQSTD